MLKRLLVLVTTIMCIGAAPAFAGGIEITRIAFNPKGADDGSNRHLNKETVYLRNTGNRTIDMSGWKLHDAGRDHVYRFGDLRVEPGDIVRIHSGRGNDGGVAGCPAGGGDCQTWLDLYWDLENYVWNNTSDTATLRKPSGDIADRCRYRVSATSPKGC